MGLMRKVEIKGKERDREKKELKSTGELRKYAFLL